MTDFTYKVPNEEDYFHTLIQWLKKKGEQELLGLLDDAKCTIYTTSSFSHSRWNGMWCKIQFYVPIEKLDPTEELVNKLITTCQEVMPSDTGFDVMKVEFLPMITSATINDSQTEDLDKAVQTISQDIRKIILPDEIKNQGIEMSRTYLYLYCTENMLRILIDNVCKEKFGENYFDKIQLNNEIKNAVIIRKQDESNNRWIRARGGADIFYLDFDHLGSIIQNNWTLFSKLFPDQSWILSKIKELAKCRNLVAHNSIVGDHEKKLIGVYFEGLLRQLAEVLRGTR